MIHYYIGHVGSGKSYKMYKTLLEGQKEQLYNSRACRSILIVPEQYAIQAQNQLFSVLSDMRSQDENCCIIAPKVYSFKRLAYEILDKNGRSDLEQMDELAKSLLIGRLASKIEKTKDFYVDSRKKGNIGKLKSVISEFEQYGISLNDIDLVLEQGNENSPDHKRLSYIKKIYESYLEYMVTNDLCFDVIKNAGVLAEKNGYFNRFTVAFDEFNGFTKSQLELIRIILSQAQKTMVALTVDQKDLLLRKTEKRSRLFYPALRTFHELCKIDKEYEFKECQYDSRMPKTLKVIRDHFGSDQKMETEANEEEFKIKIVEASDMRTELKFVCENIVKLVREKGYRYKEIVLVIPDIDTYADPLRSFSDIYRIPFEFDDRKNILDHPLSRFIIDALRTAENKGSSKALIRFAKNIFCGFDSYLLHMFENAVLSRGIRGIQAFSELEIEERVYDTDVFGAVRSGKDIIEKLGNISKFDAKTSYRTAEIIKAIRTMLDQAELERRIVEIKEKLPKQLCTEFIAAHEETIRAIGQIFEKMEGILGESLITIKEFSDLFASGLEMIGLSAPPARADAVIVKDMLRSKSRKEYKTVFMIGLNEGSYPLIKGENPLFNDRIRTEFEHQNISLSDNQEQSLMIQEYEFYRSLLMAREAVIFCCALSNDLNEQLKPSYIVDELKEITGEKVLRYGFTEPKDIYELPLSVATEASALELLVRSSDEKITSLIKEALMVSGSRKKLDIFEQDSEVYIADSGTAKKLAEKIYENNTFSVSRLERFAACPFAHFCQYELKLKQRDLYQPNVLDLGTVLHSAMEVTGKSLLERKIGFKDLTVSDVEFLSRSSVEKALINTGFTSDFARADMKHSASRIERVVRRSLQIQQHQFSVSDFELFACERQFEYKLDRNLTIHGVIDRIDRADHLVRIVDYKSGALDFDRELLDAGLQLQLPLYLKVGLDIVKKELGSEEDFIPAGIFYYRLFDPVLDFDKEKDMGYERLRKMRLTGTFDRSLDVISKIDKGFLTDNGYSASYKSTVIMADTKKDGDFTLYSKGLEKSEELNASSPLTLILEKAKNKAVVLANSIKNGKLDIAPVISSKFNPCIYCNYSSVCNISDKNSIIRNVF